MSTYLSTNPAALYPIILKALLEVKRSKAMFRARNGTKPLEFVSSRRFIDIKSNSGVFQKIVGGFDIWKTTGRLDYDPVKYLISN